MYIFTKGKIIFWGAKCKLSRNKNKEIFLKKCWQILKKKDEDVKEKNS